MSLRFKSLGQLGGGAWKVASVSPLQPQTEQAPRSPRSAGRKAQSSPPQERLWTAVRERWPEAVSEYHPEVPGRRFRIDIAFPLQRIGIEVDGFSHHAKTLDGFLNDRRRQNLLVLAGWRMLRFPAGDVIKDLPSCMDSIADLLARG